MKTQTLSQLANQIIALRSASSPIPTPLTYKSDINIGAMIALFLPIGVGSRFIQSDPGALPPNELHITLAYLGKVDDLSLRQVKEAHGLMSLISENHPPLTGHINGCGRFCNGDDNGDPFFIIPDLAALPNLRQIIIDGLKSCDINAASDHGFVPHITLTYLPHAEYNPFDILDKTPISFGDISLVLGDERYDYPLAQGVPLLGKAALIEKIGARHTRTEAALIQKIHNLTLGLGGECHPLTRRAGARHSRGDRAMIQRMHDDCAGLGAVCKALAERDPVYSSQVLKEGIPGGILSKRQVVLLASGDGLPETITTKAQSDAPNYKPASTPQRCKNCRFLIGDPGQDWCDLFDFVADQDFVCDDWETQIPSEIPGYVATKGDLAALIEGILILRGSAGSGNFGHSGRKGKLGGSGRGGGLKRIGAKKKSGPAARKKAAKKFGAKREAAAKGTGGKKQAKAPPKVVTKKPTAKKRTEKPAAKKQAAKANGVAAPKKPAAKPKISAKPAPSKIKAKPIVAKKPTTGSKKLDDIFDKAPKGTKQNFTNHLMSKMASGEISMQDAQKLNARFTTTKEPIAKLPTAKKKPTTKEKPSKDLTPGKGEKVSDGLRLGKVPESGTGKAVHDTVNTINSVHSDGKLTSIPIEMNNSKKFKGSFEVDPIFEKAKVIKIKRDGATPHMTTAHEIGHNLDFQAIGRSGAFGDTGTTFNRKKDAKVKAKFEELQKAMNDSNAISALRDRAQGSPVKVKKGGKTLEYKSDKRYSEYMLEGREMFARGYAQYIATKSGDKKMKTELASMRKKDKKAKINYHRQWEDDDFKIISKSFDDLFVELGWLE